MCSDGCTSTPLYEPKPYTVLMALAALNNQYKISTATIVAGTVTTTLSSVVVEQPQPKARVRSSNRSLRRGQMPALLTGSSKDPAGIQPPLCINLSRNPLVPQLKPNVHLGTNRTHCYLECKTGSPRAASMLLGDFGRCLSASRVCLPDVQSS